MAAGIQGRDALLSMMISLYESKIYVNLAFCKAKAVHIYMRVHGYTQTHMREEQREGGRETGMEERGRERERERERSMGYHMS